MPDPWEKLYERFPLIPWREPLPVTVTETGARGYGCRMCIAKYGLKARDVAKLAQTLEEFQKHMEECHREDRSAHP